MSEQNNGGPAFPVADPFSVKCPSNKAEALRLQQGMTLRDYFAAKAMQAMCEEVVRYDDFENCAKNAYLMADAMLKARG